MMSDTLRKCIKLMFLFLKKTACKSEEFINPFPSAIPIKEFNNIRKFIVLNLHISDILGKSVQDSQFMYRVCQKFKFFKK